MKFKKGKSGMEGLKHSEESKKKMSLAHIGKTISYKTRKKMSISRLGVKLSEETKKRMSESSKMIGKGKWNKGKTHSEVSKLLISKAMAKDKKNWNGFVKKEVRNDKDYCNWRLQVYKRDNYKCRIDNCDCSGRIIAHHILGWTENPKLRYNINNGITLCLVHHPLKRFDEKKLIPIFQNMVEVK